jgi:hypothetical protein
LASEDVFNRLGNVEFRSISAYVMSLTFGCTNVSKHDESILSARDH